MNYPEMTPREIFDYSGAVMSDSSEFVPTHILINDFGGKEEVELRRIARRRGGRYDGRLTCIFRFRVGDKFGSGVRPKDEFDRDARQIREPQFEIGGVTIKKTVGQAEIVFL